MGDLTPKQAAFVAEYLVDLNGTQAALRAGYSPKGAHVQAAQLLSNPKVQSAVSEAKLQRSTKLEVTAERVVSELADLGFYDPADIASQPMNGPEDIARLPERVRRAIIGWSWDKQGNFVLKLAPKTAALDMLGRHLGMYREKLEISGPDGGAVQLEAVRDRLTGRLARLSSTGGVAGGPGDPQPK